VLNVASSCGAARFPIASGRILHVQCNWLVVDPERFVRETSTDRSREEEFSTLASG